MNTAFKASNWRWNRNADIRDKVDRLTLEFQADTDEDRSLLARVRKAASDSVRTGQRIKDIVITLEEPQDHHDG